MRIKKVLGQNQVIGQVVTTEGLKDQVGYQGLILPNSDRLGDSSVIIGDKPLITEDRFNRRRYSRRNQPQQLLGLMYSLVEGGKRNFYLKTTVQNTPIFLATVELKGDACFDPNWAYYGEGPPEPGNQDLLPTFYWAAYATITFSDGQLITGPWSPGLSPNYTIGSVSSNGIWPRMVLTVNSTYGGPRFSSSVFPYVYSRYPGLIKDFNTPGWTSGPCSLFYYKVDKNLLGYGSRYAAGEVLGNDGFIFPPYTEQWVVGTKIPFPPSTNLDQWQKAANCNNNPDPLWLLLDVTSDLPTTWGMIYCDGCNGPQPDPYDPPISGSYPEDLPDNAYRAYLSATAEGLYWGINDNPNCVGWFEFPRNGFVSWDLLGGTPTIENAKASLDTVYINSLLESTGNPCLDFWRLDKTVNFRKIDGTQYNKADFVDLESANTLIGVERSTVTNQRYDLNYLPNCLRTISGQPDSISVLGIPVGSIVEAVVYYPM